MKRTPLDAVLSDLVRMRADWTCEYSGFVDTEAQMIWKSRQMHCSHFYGRKWLSTRHDPDNLFCLSAKAHDYLGNKPDEHAAFVRKQLGDVRYNELRGRWQAVCKRSKAETKEMLAHYKRELSRLQAARQNGETGYLGFVRWE